MSLLADLQAFCAANEADCVAPACTLPGAACDALPKTTGGVIAAHRIVMLFGDVLEVNLRYLASLGDNRRVLGDVITAYLCVLQKHQVAVSQASCFVSPLAYYSQVMRLPHWTCFTQP